MPATNPTLPQTKDNTGKNYFGLTEETFKQWYKQQKHSTTGNIQYTVTVLN